MSGVVCLKSCDQKRLHSLIQWAESAPERYVVIFDEQPASCTSSKVEFFSSEDTDIETIFHELSWKYLFMPFSYETKKGEEDFFLKLQKIQAEINFSVSDFSDQGLKILHNFKENLSRPLASGEALWGKFHKTPVIVCGAGPSLQKNIKALKEMKGKALIIAGGLAVEILKKEGIEPHFIVHIDPAVTHRFSSSKAPIFFQLRTDSTTLALSQGHRLLLAGNGNFSLEAWFEEELGLKTKPLDGGWTVGSFSVKLAHLLGCDPLILLGMDFATEKKDPEGRGGSFVPVVSEKGETLFARRDWVLAVDWLNLFALQNKDREWINASEGGLKLSEIPFKSLPSLNLPPLSDNLEEKIQKELKSLGSRAHPELWNLVQQELKQALSTTLSLIQEIEKAFPKNPLTEPSCLYYDHLLRQQFAFQQIVEPIWKVWKHVVLRHNVDGEHGLFVHRHLFTLNLLKTLIK